MYNENKLRNMLYSFSQYFSVSFYKRVLFPFSHLWHSCRRLPSWPALNISTLSKSTMPVNSHLVIVVTDLSNAFTPTHFTTVPFCPCGPEMSLDESNFGPPESARGMQFTPHIDYLNTSQFEVRQLSLEALNRFMH